MSFLNGTPVTFYLAHIYVRVPKPFLVAAIIFSKLAASYFVAGRAGLRNKKENN